MEDWRRLSQVEVGGGGLSLKLGGGYQEKVGWGVHSGGRVWLVFWLGGGGAAHLACFQAFAENIRKYHPVEKLCSHLLIMLGYFRDAVAVLGNGKSSPFWQLHLPNS